MKDTEYRKRQNQRKYEIRRIVRAEKTCDVKHFTHRWDTEDDADMEREEAA